MKLESEKQTIDLARKTAQDIERLKSPEGALVLAFSGELGAGKTTFIKGFAEELGIQKIQSPTFLIMKKHPVSEQGFDFLFHVDAYRIELDDLSSLNFESILKNPNHIVLIEWAERVREALPSSTLWIEMSHGSHENERMINFKNFSLT